MSIALTPAHMSNFLRRWRRRIFAHNVVLVSERHIDAAAPDPPMRAEVQFREATVEDIDLLTMDVHGYGDFRKGQAKREIENGNGIVLGINKGRPIYLN